MFGPWVILPSDPANQYIILKIVGFLETLAGLDSDGPDKCSM